MFKRLLLLALLVPAGTASADSKSVINQLLDGWHHAAAVADEKTFFGLLDTGAIYLGTDATERWLKSEFEKWAEPHFKRDTAWAFTPHDRTVYLSADGGTAWFEEYLETRMGECRGSGVLVKKPEGWKLAHYHLALTVPNDKIQGFMELVGAPGKDR